jgi:phosphomannomutase/phosphoglucomutase
MLLTASTAEEEEKGQAPQAAAAVLSEGRSGTEPIPAQIFRAYDIRGIVDEELTAPLVHDIGRAVGTEAREAGDQTVIVGRDTRPSGKVLLDSLVAGLRKSGCDVLDLGVVPTPLVYFTTHYQGTTSGVMVTASHNPVNYSGLKIVVGGATLDEERISELRERILSKSFSEGDGKYRAGDLIPDYVDHVAKDVAIARTLKVVVDCGNAAAAVVAPQLYHALGCDLVELDCDPSAGFPDGRVPDPTRPECLEALQYAVVSQGADLGLAFDADGDSLGIVDSSGKIIWPDRVLMLLAADVLSRHPGTDVVFDVNSSHHLASEILRHSGRPVMWKSGHGPLKAKLRDTGALIGGERSGHIIFRERWFGFDDALYSGARLLEVLALDPRPSAEVFATLPEALSTPEFVLPLAEGESTRIMKAVIEQAKRLKGFDLITVDGLRVESEQSWGLVRASNTQPALSFRFEAEDEVGLSKIQYLLRRIMERAAPELELPF